MRSFDDKVEDIVAFLTRTTGRQIHPVIAQIMREEGNYEEWIQDGFLCRINRPPYLGAWCGYVRVPRGHKFYGLDNDYIPLEVHGGITYSAPEFPMLIDGEKRAEEGFWWIGFDCAHADDYIPGMVSMEFGSGYRNKLYVKDQVRELVLQLKLIE